MYSARRGTDHRRGRPGFHRCPPCRGSEVNTPARRPAACCWPTGRDSIVMPTNGFTKPGGNAGVVPTNDGLACVWVGMPAARFAGRTSPDALYTDLLGRGGTGPRPHGLSAARSGPRLPGCSRVRPTVQWSGLGIGRRRRVLQGPDHGARHDRCATGRRTPCAGGHLGAGGGSTTGCGLGRVPGRPGSSVRPGPRNHRANRLLRWDLSEIQDLLPELSRAMRPEVEAIRQFDGATTVRAEADAAAA